LETVTANKLYEGMFLVDSALAGADWNRVISLIEKIFERAGAEVISLKKWDERRLAYEINHKDRGTYILTYFRVDGSKIQSIERDVRLSEDLLRVLILNAEVMSSEDIEKETPVGKIEREKADREKAEQDKIEQAKADREKAEQDKIEQAKADREKAEIEKAEEAAGISEKIEESSEPELQDVSTKADTNEESIQQEPESSSSESEIVEGQVDPQVKVVSDDAGDADTDTDTDTDTEHTAEQADEAKSEEK